MARKKRKGRTCWTVALWWFDGIDLEMHSYQLCSPEVVMDNSALTKQSAKSESNCGVCQKVAFKLGES